MVDMKDWNVSEYALRFAPNKMCWHMDQARNTKAKVRMYVVRKLKILWSRFKFISTIDEKYESMFSILNITKKRKIDIRIYWFSS